MFFTHLSTADISFVHQLSNLHGMWAGDPVTVPARRSRDSSNPTCGVSQFPEGAWDSVHADFLRRQRERFNSDVPFTEEGELYVKHTPHITFKDDGTAHVLVGEAGVATHPMTGSPDGTYSSSEPHWITEIYVKDTETNKIVAMETLDSTGVDTATLDFDVPKSAKSLQAFAWCNLHGLWVGPTAEVATVATSGGSDDNSAASLFDAAAVTGAALLTAFVIM